MKLSIIVCIYNTKKRYFKECLDSITNSTLTDYEIIVLDDGSDIDYSDILADYKVRYVKTENRGILAARLYALALSDGDYVAFVDSDDTVSFNFHQPMVDEAIRTDADIVINDWAFFSQRARYVCTRDVTISKNIYAENDDILKTFVEWEGRQHAFFVLWNKLFKKDLLIHASNEIVHVDLAFAPISYSEDALINFFAFRDAKKLLNVHTGYYFYRVHPGQSVNVTSREKLINQIDSMTDTLRAMKQHIGDNKHKDEILARLQKWTELMARSHYSHAKSKNYYGLSPYIKEKYGVKKLRHSSFKDGSAYTKNKILADNFTDIDKALLEIYRSGNQPTDAYYDVKDEYVSRMIDCISKSQNRVIAYSTDAKFVVPKSNISFKTKLFHNRIVYCAGMILFKKGSRIRSFLKKHF